MLLWLLVHIEAFLEKTRHDTWTLHQRGRGSTQEWNVSRFSQSKGASNLITTLMGIAAKTFVWFHS
jgi:hypothetical protein